jgi:hypothetical protein
MGWDDTSDFYCQPEQVGNIIECVCELKKTIECVAECFSGHLSSGTKQKILFCLVLQEIKNIEDLLTNKVFGLNEIKNEIRSIENAVLNPTFGLNEIKNEIRNIENTVLSPTIGLNEIKNEIKGIENTLGNFSFNIILDINNEVVAGINEIINNEVFGLNEIKNEIRAIENNTGTAAVLTTGPVLAPASAKNLTIKVLNNSQSNQTVQIHVFNLAECPKCLNLIYNAPLGPIPVSCACEVKDIDLKNATEYEVEVSSIVPGIYLWSGAAPGSSSNFATETVFRHVDFVRQVFNNC